jgi:hypothetical protein
VSEYTDKIDILIYNKPKRIVAQIKELCAILSGLVMSSDFQLGQELFKDRDFKANEAFYKDIFELGVCATHSYSRSSPQDIEP